MKTPKMKAAFLKYTEWYVAIAIICLGILLRVNNYWIFPGYGETRDEWAWGWLGASILSTGQPITWSYFSSYEPYIYKDIKNNPPLVRPALDHPPLFSIIPGSFHAFWAMQNGSSWEEMPSSKVIRLPMVLLGSVNLVIFYLVARKLFKNNPRWTPFFALLFATAPLVVFSSRLVVAENLIVSLELALLLLLNHASRPSPRMLVAIGTLCAFAVLTKISGIVLPLSLIVLGIVTNQTKLTKAAGLSLIAGVLMLVIYAGLYNLPLFFSVQLEQGARDLGLATLHNRLFLHPSIVRDLFVEGWLIVGIFSLVSLQTSSSSRWLPISIMGIMTLGFIALTSGEQTFHGWYNYPLFPLLFLAFGKTVLTCIKEKRWLLFGLMWLFLMPAFRLALTYGGYYTDVSPFVVRGVMLAGFLPFLFESFNKPLLAKYSLAVLLSTLVLAHLATVVWVSHEAYTVDDAFFLYR